MLTCLLLVGLAACHSSRQVATIDGKGNKSSIERSISGEDWAALSIKLARNDNQQLYHELRFWLGTPYQFGGNTRDGVDCSGLVQQVYNKVYKKHLARNSALIFERNCLEVSRSDLREGDLVFFITGSSSKINHVGIYLKDNKFVHASSRGVRVDDLKQHYYDTHFVAAGRVK